MAQQRNEQAKHYQHHLSLHVSLTDRFLVSLRRAIRKVYNKPWLVSLEECLFEEVFPAARQQSWKRLIGRISARVYAVIILVIL